RQSLSRRSPAIHRAHSEGRSGQGERCGRNISTVLKALPAFAKSQASSRGAEGPPERRTEGRRLSRQTCACYEPSKREGRCKGRRGEERRRQACRRRAA